MQTNSLASAFSLNRAEELGFDVWDEFVIPSRLKIDRWSTTQKPRVVVGGRGCGKTMLLRYLSHESAFSRTRPKLDQSALDHVGVYWRADTQFASLLDGRDQPDDLWRAAFTHLSSLVLGKEILRALESIAESTLALVDSRALHRIDFALMSTRSLQIPSDITEFREFLDRELLEFELWANDIRKIDQPRFLHGTQFLRRIIDVALDQLDHVPHARIFVYIDEYENLTLLQQQIVNTWIKHSEQPLVFNLAMKRNGFKTRRTLGEESIVETHDYRTVDLEEFDRDADFHIFAAEILLFRLHAGGASLPDFQPELLRDPSAVGERSTRRYAAQVLELAKGILPTWTRESLTEQILDDTALQRALRQRLEDGLRRRDDTTITAESFLDRQELLPGAVVIPALLARQRLRPSQVAEEFEKYCTGKRSSFRSGQQWVHNLFIACYLDLFSSVVRPCPLYSGFDTFCRMAKGNLRHFLELCHRAISTIRTGDEPRLSPQQQAGAARQVAASLLPEVRSFGPLGNDLHSFLLRLGTLFSLSQKRLSQSEPERTHFAIRDGEDAISRDSRRLLSEAVKWSVLFEEKETKVKSIGSPVVVDYVLNPIYAPYFHISYRKGRKLELSAHDFDILSSGTTDDFKERLYRRYRDAWSIRPEQLTGSLPLMSLQGDRDT